MSDQTKQLRSILTDVAAQVVDRAQEMIRSGMSVESAFKLAIAWELEVQCVRTMQHTANECQQRIQGIEAATNTILTAFVTAIECNDHVKMRQLVDIVRNQQNATK